MNLGDEAPEQKLAILAIGGFLLVFNVIMYFKDSSKGSTSTAPVAGSGPEAMVTQVVDENTGAIHETATLHQNPSVGWMTRVFCTGFKRSSWCSDRELHPDVLEADANGVDVSNMPRPRDHVIAYRGPMQREGMFSGRVSIPDQDASDKYWDLESSR